MHKKLSFWLILAYSTLSFITEFSFSSSLVLISLVGLHGFELYLDRSRESDKKEDPEYLKLKKELELEGMKLSLDQLKEEQVRRAELRASRLEGVGNERPFTF